MTAYGLLTYTLLGDVASALPVVKWLSQQRNALGGFSSTQVDLSVRLLSPFGSVTYSGVTQVFGKGDPERLIENHFSPSTPVQDTCVALQALSEYAILSYVGGVNLTISLASTNLDFQEAFELNRDNQKLLQSAKASSFPRRSLCSAADCQPFGGFPLKNKKTTLVLKCGVENRSPLHCVVIDEQLRTRAMSGCLVARSCAKPHRVFQEQNPLIL